MPNVRPPTLDAARLRQKLDIAARDSRVNYAFYLGANGENLESIRALDPRAVAGIKVFMGSSTGDMVIDDEERLRAIFTAAPCLVAAHCEDDKIVAANLEIARARFGGDIPPRAHAQIRDARACFSSSSRAARIARETGARLHILHITTAPSWIYSRPATATSKSPPRPARIICFFATTIMRGWECGSNAIRRSKPAPTATPCATLCATGESMSPPPTTRRIWPPKKTPLTKKPRPACR